MSLTATRVRHAGEALGGLPAGGAVAQGAKACGGDDTSGHQQGSGAPCAGLLRCVTIGGLMERGTEHVAGPNTSFTQCISKRSQQFRPIATPCAPCIHASVVGSVAASFSSSARAFFV